MLDGAGNEQDKGSTENLSQPSALEKLTSGIEEGKQYTGAETKKLVEDALSADGREQKTRAEVAEAENKLLKTEVQTVTGQVSTLTTQMADISRAQNEAEAAAIKDDPAALGSLRVKQANSAEKLRLEGVATAQAADKAALAAREATVANQEKTSKINLAAMAAGVDVTKLTELVPDGDPTRLATAATLLKAQAAPEIDPVTGKPKEAVPKPPGLTTQPASTKSAGGDPKSVSESMLEKAKAKAGVK